MNYTLHWWHWGLIIAFVGVALFGGWLFLAPNTSTVPVADEIPLTKNVQGETILPLVVKEGVFIATESHPGDGAVSLLTHNGEQIIRLTNFTSTAGPDLFVYLSSDKAATDFVNLGALKSTSGEQNYQVPAAVETERYPYVLIWCKRFGVLFMSALLTEGEIPKNTPTVMDTSTTDGDKTPLDQEAVVASPTANSATALFGNGCFWCVEHDLEKVAGVVSVVSGYTGGSSDNPTYDTYKAHGHREVVAVTYDPKVVTYANLVEHIIKHGDPTDASGSFYDRGTSYAPAIYYANEAEAKAARQVIENINASGVFTKPLPLPVLPTSTFYPAEAYHQDYAANNPLRYNYYRAASGRTAFIKKTWGEDLDRFTYSNVRAVKADESLVETSQQTNMNTQFTPSSWANYQKPNEATLRSLLSDVAYRVTQEDSTERAGTSPYDKNYERGIYVDIVSGEPLFSSRDKFDSGTGWPSFVVPISPDAITTHEDRKLFSIRTEVRSRYADSHLGHVFNDGPRDRGGLRYCMNGAALRFISEADMVGAGYEAWLATL
jgi:peptide methionine sulfoxide reductase msrA/msrB